MMTIDRTRWRGALLVLGLMLQSQPLAAQNPAAPQVTLSADATEISLGGRVQTQLNTTSVDALAPSELIIRRARLEVDVRIDELVTATINPEFAGEEVSLKDAWVNLAFSPAVNLRAGNMKRPFGLFDLTSSKRMPVIERGLRIRGVEAADEYVLVNGLEYGDRDVGVMLLGAPAGAPLGIAYAAGVFRGPLHGVVGDEDSYQLTARATVTPATSVRLGAAWSSRDFSDDAGGTPGLRRGQAFEIDLEYGAFDPGIHLLAELSTGDLDPFADTRFRGAQAWLAYRTRSLGRRLFAIEPVLRISHAETDGGAAIPGGTLLTPGINLYLTALTRIMLGYDVWRGGDGSADATSFKAMVQAAF